MVLDEELATRNHPERWWRIARFDAEWLAAILEAFLSQLGDSDFNVVSIELSEPVTDLDIIKDHGCEEPPVVVPVVVMLMLPSVATVPVITAARSSSV